MQDYYWVFDSLNSNVPLKTIADSIIENFHYHNLTSIRNFYPMTLSISLYDKSRIGLCQDAVNYFVHLFRALGIASSDDYVPHWGNHHSSGHSWLRLQYGNEIYCEKNLRIIYKHESIPKIQRRTFSLNKTPGSTPGFYKDVTQDYKLTTDIIVENIFNTPKGQPVLCVFDIYRKWAKVAEGEKQGYKLSFNNMGTNVLYLPAYYSFGQIHPVNYPFFVDSVKNLHYFIPSTTKNDSVILLRKAGFITPRNKTKKQWIDSLNYGIFQGSNDLRFKHAQTLAKIGKLNSPQPQMLSVNSKEAFKYARFYANKHEAYLALLEFFNSNGQKISGNLSATSNILISWKDGALDDDQLTFFGGKDFSLVLEFNPPRVINAIRFQARNDGNHIDKRRFF